MRAYYLTHDLPSSKTETALTYQEQLACELARASSQLFEQQLDEKLTDWVMALGLGAASLGSLSAIYDYLAAKHAVEPTAVTGKITANDVAKPLAKLKPLERTLLMFAGQRKMSEDELKQLMAQSAHETMNFTTLEEIGTDQYFARKYDIRHNPRKAKILGNTQPGDGVRFKGRGYLQITGRDNYSRASQAIFGDDRLVRNPELAALPEVAAKTALWFWANRVAPKVQDFTSTKQATKPINPALKGLADREAKYAKYAASTLPPVHAKRKS